MKRLILCIGLLAIVFGTFSLPALAQDKVTLNWLEWWDPEYSAATMDKLVAGFEATHPNITIQRTAVPWGNMYDNLVTSAQSATATYDLMGMEFIWMTGLDKLGMFEDLTPWFAKAPKEWQDARADGTQVSWNGQVSMAYWYIFPYSLAYNVDMLEKAGVKPPTNWDEFVAAVKALRDEKNGTYGFGISAGTNLTATYFYLGGLLQQLGGSMLDKDGQPSFNSPEGVKAMEDWKALYDSGYVVPGSPSETIQSTREYFAAGKIAMIWDGPFIGSIAKQTNPNIKVAYAPAWKDTTGGYVWAGSGLAMAKNSAHKEETWEFLQYLLSSDVAKMMTEATSIPYATKDIFSDVLPNSTDPILSQIPAMLTQDPDHNYFLHPIPEFETTHDALMQSFQEILSGDKDAKTALDEAAAVWKTEIDAASS